MTKFNAGEIASVIQAEIEQVVITVGRVVGELEKDRVLAWIEVLQQ